MLKGADISQRVNFSSKEDKSDPKTIFILRPLSGFEAFEVSQNIDIEGQRLTAEYISALLGKSIVEIKNPDLTEPQGMADFIASLPMSILMELITEANMMNKLSEQEEKN